MRPTTSSTDPAEDLHSILNRFHNWAGNPPENHNGHRQNAAGVREIPMEEAIRQLRSRRATTTPGSAEKQALAQPQKEPSPVETKVELASQSALVNRPISPVAKATETLGVVAQAGPPAKTAATPTKKPATKRGKTRQTASAAPAQQPARKTAAVHKSAANTAAKTAQRPAAKKAPRKAEFREVLVRSLPAKTPDRKPERRQRVSVRLSGAEERRLQQLAGAAGITISEYLRRSALQAKTADRAPSIATKTGLRHGKPAAAAPLFASTNSESSSVLGGWLTLLRNRFLASPTRFAERA